ncbi:MAG: SDR family oxidoreductase [Bacteroidales bacterium]|nr:SDR family oxidoreductase [Bacteroidales bacterium]
MNVVVTGAGRGIGRETAKGFALQTGNTVFAISRDQHALNRLAGEMPGNAGTIVPLAMDLTLGDFTSLKAAIALHGGLVDILVNNAGGLVNKPFEKLTDKDFDYMFGANVKSAFMLIRALMPFFGEGSHIVNIGSMGGFQGSAKFPGLSLYSASKGALAVLTECLAEEFKERKISVNCLAIGAVQTEMLSQAFPGYRAPVMPEEMGLFIREFALTGTRFFNGKIIPVALSNP